MVKITTGDGGYYRLPSLRGEYYSYSRNGRLVVCAWPRPKKTKPTPRELDTRAMFRARVEAMKLMTAEEQIVARERAKGTRFLPRDLLLKCLAGRLGTPSNRQGKRLYSMSTAIALSEFLDVAGDTPGGMLMRGDTWWQYVPPGNPGDILRFGTLPNLATWGPPTVVAGAATTLLVSTSDGTVNSTWPKWCTFQSAVIDDLNIWNPATPDRLVIPSGISRLRIGGGFRLTATTTQRVSNLFVTDPTDVGLLGGWPRAVGTFGQATFPQIEQSAWGSWNTVPAIAYVRLRANVAAAYSGGFLSGSWLSMSAA